MLPSYIEAFAKLLAAVAWPIVALALVLTQRAAISRLLHNIRKVKAGGVEAELTGAVAEEALRSLETSPKAGAEPPTPADVAAARRVKRIASKTDPDVVRRQVVELARDYETTRAQMEMGPKRTRSMEVLVTKMRSLAFAADFMLPELTNSASPGERLAAIAILQIRPDPRYFDWLASRFGAEAAFAEYHAAVALLVAAKSNPQDRAARAKLSAALKTAQSALKEKGTDREKTLQEAERVLAAG